jgi:hypothetical protein
MTMSQLLAPTLGSHSRLIGGRNALTLPFPPSWVAAVREGIYPRTRRRSPSALAGLGSLDRIIEGEDDFRGLSRPECYRLRFVHGFSVHTHG